MGPGFTPYSLRRSFATLASITGEVDRIVSGQMGHSRTDFTKDVYVQVEPEMRQGCSDRLEQLLFGAVGTQLTDIEAEGTM